MSAAKIVEDVIKANVIAVFSKSYCPCEWLCEGAVLRGERAKGQSGRQMLARASTGARCTASGGKTRDEWQAGRNGTAMPLALCQLPRQDSSRSSMSPFSLSHALLPDCTRVKKALPSLNQSSIKILELDEMSNGSELQNSLAEKTGQRSVPNIFINGTHVGGCDDFFAKQKSGEIEKLLKQ
jgi:glutaredoxin 3